MQKMFDDETITPKQIRSLPVHDGQPVPFMTPFNEAGEPQHHELDHGKLAQCFVADLCPLCGQGLGAHATIWCMGLPEIVNRVVTLPAMHTLCAVWGAARGRFVPPGLVFTLERHHRYEIAENKNGRFMLMLASPPDAVTWWLDHELLVDRETIIAWLAAYERTAIELCDDVDQRTGLNLALSLAFEMLVPVVATLEVDAQ